MSVKKMLGVNPLVMIKPFIKPFIDAFIPAIISKKKEIELSQTETEVCILFQEVDGKIIASAPVFDNNDKIVRYADFDGEEAVNISDLIEKFLQPKSKKNATAKV